MNAILLICIIMLLIIITVQSWKIVDASATLQGRHPLVEEKFLYYLFGIPAVLLVFWLLYSLIPL